jgi:hypothetical protein
MRCLRVGREARSPRAPHQAVAGHCPRLCPSGPRVGCWGAFAVPVEGRRRPRPGGAFPPAARTPDTRAPLPHETPARWGVFEAANHTCFLAQKTLYVRRTTPTSSRVVKTYTRPSYRIAATGRAVPTIERSGRGATDGPTAATAGAVQAHMWKGWMHANASGDVVLVGAGPTGAASTIGWWPPGWRRIPTRSKNPSLPFHSLYGATCIASTS